MARSRTYWPAILATLFVVTEAQISWAENPTPGVKTYSLELPSKTKDVPSHSKHKYLNTWRVYRLDSMENDPNFGQWVADTIQATIPKDEPGTVKYYAPSRILAVYHTPFVQAEVEAFLDNLRYVRPPGKERLASSIAKSPVSVPAKFPISLVKATDQGTSLSPGPATQQPRHLIHITIQGLQIFDEPGEKIELENLTIRYEGEGIIDSNLAWLIKSLNEQTPDKGQESGKPALNTADLTRYIKDLLAGSGSVPAYAPAVLPEPESPAKTSEATEPAPAPKPSGDGPPTSGTPIP